MFGQRTKEVEKIMFQKKRERERERERWRKKQSGRMEKRENESLEKGFLARDSIPLISSYQQTPLPLSFLLQPASAEVTAE